jgi:GNAT superfamily N-acetyltransferase
MANSSRIRPALLAGEAATIARTDVHYVVTEYGIAYLFGKSIRQRATALIELAHPKFRPELFAQAQALGYLSPDQTLQNLRAYPVEEELTITLKDGRTVMLRPALSSDAHGIRDLFHHLSEADVYTRFFRHVRGLSNAEVQRLCNVNYENEVAFVATFGPAKEAQIVGQSCYFINPTTNLADTAYMVHPEWQGCGLGSALQNPAWRTPRNAAARFCGRCAARQPPHAQPGTQRPVHRAGHARQRLRAPDAAVLDQAPAYTSVFIEINVLQVEFRTSLHPKCILRQIYVI